MSGIVGIWNLDGRPVESLLLAKLSKTLAHRGPDGEGQWIQESVGMACHLSCITPEAATETQPLIHSSGVVLLFDGRLDNREELLAVLPNSAQVSAALPDSAFVTAAYDAFGEQFLERLNGEYALALFDPRQQKLLLARDAIGLRPLYYCHAGNTFIFASEIKALMAHPHVNLRPDKDSLAGYMLRMRRSYPNDEGLTFFEGIFSLPPAYAAVLTRERFVTRRYWDFDAMGRVRFASFDEYADGFRHYFEQAVKRRLRSAHPVAMSVSGGLDSSSIFCQAQTLKQRDPESYPELFGISYTSADGSPSDEKDFLLAIEKQYGVAIERFPVGQGFVNKSREQLWHVESPTLDVQWHTSSKLYESAQQLGARTLLMGYWGDHVLFDQSYLIDLFRSMRWLKVWADLNEFGRWNLDVDPRLYKRRFFRSLIRSHVPEAVVPVVRNFRQIVTRETSDLPWYVEDLHKRARRASRRTRIRGKFATAHAKSIYQITRTWNHSLQMEALNKAVSMYNLEISFPYLDRDLLSFIIQIPGEMQNWKGVPRAILREAMRGVLPDVIRERRTKADFTYLVNGGVEAGYSHLLRYLHPEGKSIQMSFLKRNEVSKLAEQKDRLQRPNCEFAWSLIDLFGLELWLRIFFENRKFTGEEI